MAILFLGSVFSPYYALARRLGPAPAEHHCAVNLALYLPGRKFWAMTERGVAALARDATTLRIGPSRLVRDDHGLLLEVEERCAPWPRRLRGRIRIHPELLSGRVVELAPQGGHRWWPIAPRARVEAAFDSPPLRFVGHGYLDANEGCEPLEARFRHWTWSRAGDGETTVILYDAIRRDGSALSLALRATAAGSLEPFAPPPLQILAPSRWGLVRTTRVDPGHRARLVRSLEDGPFYARAQLATRLAGRMLPAVHECLSLDRFARLWVQLLLPFRMPRRAGWPPHRPGPPRCPDRDRTGDRASLDEHEASTREPGSTGARSSFRDGRDERTMRANGRRVRASFTSTDRSTVRGG